MAKRKRRKHRPSAKYLLFASKSKPKSIIPTITKQPDRSAYYKQIRNEMAKVFREQQKVEIPKPKQEYTSNKKKNRREAREKRKEKKQKRKQQRQQQQEQPQQEQPQQETLQEEETEEIPTVDPTEDYLDDLKKKLEYVYQLIIDEHGAKDNRVFDRFKSLQRAMLWIDNAKQLDYFDRVPLIKEMEESVHIEEVTSILAYRYYTEMVEASEDIASTIEAIVTSFL